MIHQHTVAAYRQPDRAKVATTMTALITSLSAGIPKSNDQNLWMSLGEVV